MLGRRSFFKRLAAVVAVVALAPEIAFSRKLDFHELDIDAFIKQVFALSKLRPDRQTIDVYCDARTAKMFAETFQEYQRQRASTWST